MEKSSKNSTTTNCEEEALPLKKVSVLEFADIIGITRQGVYKAIKEKRIVNSVTEMSEGNYEIEVMTGVLEWFHKTRTEYSSKSKTFKTLKTIADLPSEAESEQVLAFFRARQAERDDMEAEGKVISLDEANMEIANANSILRDRLTNLGSEYAHAANPKNPDLARKVMTDAITNTLRNLATEQLSLLEQR